MSLVNIIIDYSIIGLVKIAIYYSMSLVNIVIDYIAWV